MHVGMGFGQGFQAFRSGDDTQELDALGMAALDNGDGVHGRAAGGQHGVQNNHIPLLNIRGQLVVILHRLQRLVVPVKTDVPHLCGRHQFQHAVHHAQACPQNGDESQLPAGDHLGGGFLHGGHGFHVHQGKVPGGLVAHQSGNLADQLPEIFGAGGNVPQERKLVLDQRMVHYKHIFIVLHGVSPPFLHCVQLTAVRSLSERSGRSGAGDGLPRTRCSGKCPPV